MTDTTSPSGTVEASPMTFGEGVDAIENLLTGDPETDLAQTDEAKEASETETPEVEETDDDDVELVLDDDETDEGDDSTTDAPPAITDDFKVKLDDGMEISLGELKRNNLFQRDYSRKTEELKAEKVALQQDFEKRVTEAENEIRQKRELVFELYKHVLPDEPSMELLQTDPVGYMEQKAAHEHRLRELNQLWGQKTAEQQKAEEQAAAQYEQVKNAEWDSFLEKVPRLKDEARMEAFRKDVSEIGVGQYGIKQEELPQIVDSRYLQILHDAIQYRKALAKAGAVKKEVASKPRLETKQRMSPQKTQVRDQQGRFEALRQTGSIDAAAKAIENLI